MMNLRIQLPPIQLSPQNSPHQNTTVRPIYTWDNVKLIFDDPRRAQWYHALDMLPSFKKIREYPYKLYQPLELDLVHPLWI